jgi:hypothetical protein
VEQAAPDAGPGSSTPNHLGSSRPTTSARHRCPACQPLLDLQLVLDHLPQTRTAATWALAAATVLVTGNFSAIDRHDTRHPETS